MKYIITAGGTGGHLKPAILLANELIQKNKEVLFIAGCREMDFKMLQGVKFEVIHLNMQGFNRKKTFSSMRHNLHAFYLLVKASVKVKTIYKNYCPEIIIGFGGYVTYPVVKEGIRRKKFAAIHEQNSFPGVVNRKLSKQVSVVFYCFESSTRYLNNTKKFNFSNPVCDEFQSSSTVFKQWDILFLGGSLGAEMINQSALDYADKNRDKKILLISGGKQTNKGHENIKILDYLSDLKNVILSSEIVVTRGGASTLLECAAAQKKIIVIPSPNVTSNHQYKNALDLIDKAELVIIKEENYNLRKLEKAIKDVKNINIYTDNFDEPSKAKILEKIEELYV